MNSENPAIQNVWNEETSKKFIDYGRYFAPKREYQMRKIVELLSDLDQPLVIVELCCGEGLLAEILLDTLPTCTVHAFDGSIEMLERAQKRLARFGDRFQWKLFDLASESWRSLEYPVNAVVSSLAIHHLTGSEKQKLYQDVYKMLSHGGAFIIADLVEVVSQSGKRLAAEEWDDAVLKRSLELDGNTLAFDFFVREGWNMHRYLDPDDIDKPSPLFDQLKWLESAGFTEVDVYWVFAGHAIFGARKL